MTIYNEMRKRRPDLLALLFEPLHTDRRGEMLAGQKPWHDIPVFNWYEGRLSALYARRYIELARRFPEVPPLRRADRGARPLRYAGRGPQDHHADDVPPGDMQWAHNHTMLHYRTAFEDWPEPERRRHLLRLWLASRSASPAQGLCTAVRQGRYRDRGGIMVPGAPSMRRWAV